VTRKAQVAAGLCSNAAARSRLSLLDQSDGELGAGGAKISPVMSYLDPNKGRLAARAAMRQDRIYQ